MDPNIATGSRLWVSWGADTRFNFARRQAISAAFDSV